MSKLPHIEIILPVYNEIQSIGPLLDQLDGTAKWLSSQATLSFLFINDGSTDGTRRVLERLEQSRKDIRLVNLIHNFGHSAAITCGLNEFKGDAAIVMDADLQDSPTAIIDLFTAWKNGAKTAVAERGSRAEKNAILFRAFYYLLHKISPTLPPINFGTFSILDKTVVDRINKLDERNRYFPGLISFASDKIVPIKVNRQARAHGNSRVGILGLIQLAISAFVSFSNAPLRVASIMGLVTAGCALLAAVGIVSIKLFTNLAIPGWASILTSTFFGSGVQLLCLGIMGEYIARIYDEVKSRPPYLLEEPQTKKTRSTSRRRAA